jgi:hypothetical protein
MKSAPFNSCDYLCEKCARTEECPIYALLKEKARSKRTCGEAGAPPAVFLEDVKESLDEAMEMLQEMAAGMDIEFDDAAIEDLDECYIDRDELYQLSLTFTLKVHTFLKRIEGLIRSRNRDAFEDIAWHHTIVSVKIHRAVASDYNGLSDDAIASVGVALKSLTKCSDALTLIGKTCASAEQESRMLLNTAVELKRQPANRFTPRTDKALQ